MYEDEPDNRWIQVGLSAVEGGDLRPLYESLAALVQQLLQTKLIVNTFFMHKPPGIRLRIETTDGTDKPARNTLNETLQNWRLIGRLGQIEHAVYEPETYLFGGHISMASVHRLFTADSLAWLQYHSLAGRDEAAAGPAWALSLAMLRAVFTGLGITDWEDLDVWDRVRTRLGRSLPPDALDLPQFQKIGTAMCSRWNGETPFVDGMSPQIRTIVNTFASAAFDITAVWRREYFSTESARIGPRAAAALITIFHWNRAALSMTRQALIVESLLTRETV